MRTALASLVLLAATPAFAATRLETVRQRGVLRVGTTGDYPPFTYRANPASPFIGVDVELDGTMPIGRAHAIATEFEAAIRDEFGADVEIETHIEPLTVALLEGADASQSLHESITAHLKVQAPSEISDVHNVRVRENSQGLIVNYHCRVHPDLTVADIHTLVDRLEQKAKAAFPQIARIVSHTEPLRSTP